MYLWTTVYGQKKFIYNKKYDQKIKIMETNYFLCSKAVVEPLKPTEVSNPFKSGYKGNEDVYFVAKIDYLEAAKQYKLVRDCQEEFWCREIVDDTMDIDDITLGGIKENGLFHQNQCYNCQEFKN